MAEQTPTEEMTALLESYKGLSEKRREEILEVFTRHLPAEVRALYPTTSRGCVVGHVEIYGLTIDVDANGHAQRVALAGTEDGTAPTTDGFDVEWCPATE